MAGPAQLSRHLVAGASEPRDRLAGLLSRPGVRTALTIAAAGEMAIDKLPVVPDRIEPGPLFGRALFGGLTGGVLAARGGRSHALGTVAGAVGAVGGAFLGYHLRRALTRRAGLPDLPIALAEDALAIALARSGVEVASSQQ